MDAEDSKVAFRAIRDFVDDLWDLFDNKSKKTTPLGLYRRLTQCIKEDEPGPGIDKCLSGFRLFLTTYSGCLSDPNEMMETIPRDTVIRYGTSKNVYLEIQKYLYQTKGDDREVIRQHLLTIAAIIEPSEEALASLENAGNILGKMGLNDDSNESKFIGNIMGRARSAMENVNTEDPSEAIMGLLGSGLVPDIIQGLQSGVENGSLDMNKLLGGLQGAMASMGVPGNQNASAVVEDDSKQEA